MAKRKKLSKKDQREMYKVKEDHYRSVLVLFATGFIGSLVGLFGENPRNQTVIYGVLSIVFLIAVLIIGIMNEYYYQKIMKTFK